MGMLGKRVLNTLGAALTGVDFMGMQSDREREKQRQDFMAQLAGRLGPQYETSPAPRVELPQIIGFDPSGENDRTIGAPALGRPRVQSNTQDYEYQAPRRTADTGLTANSPDLGKIVLQANQLGVPVKDLLDVLKTQQPDVRYDRGYGYNGKTGDSAGAYHAELGEGEEPLFDANGKVAYIRNIDGSVRSAAERAGAIKGAEAAAQAPYEFQTFQGPDGRPVTGAKSALAGQVFTGQSPTEATQAASATEAAIHLPQSLATSRGALELIAQLKQHPGLDVRTGLTSVLPPIPGTPGADFDTMASQLKGKVFLEAFASLKGSGAITEREGEAATNAIARLNQRQTKDGYVAALDDLQRVIRAGMERQQQKAGVRQPTAAPALKSIPMADRVAEARRRGLIQ